MIFYWGCWKEAGHYLHWPGGRNVTNEDCNRYLIPSPNQLDGTHLFLPRPEQIGIGVCTYLPAPNRTILAWWGNPWDTRGNVNSAVIVDGHADAKFIWQEFEKHFPDIVSEMREPTLDGV